MNKVQPISSSVLVHILFLTMIIIVDIRKYSFWLISKTITNIKEWKISLWWLIGLNWTHRRSDWTNHWKILLLVEGTFDGHLSLAFLLLSIVVAIFGNDYCQRWPTICSSWRLTQTEWYLSLLKWIHARSMAVTFVIFDNSCSPN